MSETEIETEVASNTGINIATNAGFPMGAGRGRGSRTPTPNRPGSVISGMDQNYSALKRRIKSLKTRLNNMISQQNSLLERLLSISPRVFHAVRGLKRENSCRMRPVIEIARNISRMTN